MILLSRLLALALLAACVFSPVAQAKAVDPSILAARHEGDAGANPHDLVQGAHVEGHIAFLHAELAITPAQETLWANVEAAMREDVKNVQDAESKAFKTPGPDNAVDYLEQRVAFAKLRAQGEARFLTAFRPLYDSLSTRQKQTADELLIPNALE